MILIVRYTFLGALDAIAKKSDDKMLERVSQIEDKVRDLHKLAFTGFLEASEIKKVKKKLKEEK